MPTLIGVFFTIIILAIAVALLIKQGDALIYKLRPVVNRNLLYDIIPQNTTLNPNEFMMFSYYFSGNNTILFDKRYFNVNIMNYKLIS